VPRCAAAIFLRAEADMVRFFADTLRDVGYLNTLPFGADFLQIIHRVPLRQGGTMEGRYIEELRGELTELLHKQSEVLESRAFGSAADSDILEYEIRQEVIHEICNQLANSAAA
jgi:hypothetical protein